MLTIDSLKEYGADTAEGLTRCFGNADFYLRLVGMELEDANFARLGKAMEEKNARDVFEASHALKGALGNLSLTPLYQPVCELTELTRGQTELSGAEELYAEIVKQLEKLRALR